MGLVDTEGNWIIENQDVEKVAVDYFDDLFKTTSPSEFEGFFGRYYTITPDESAVN